MPSFEVELPTLHSTATSLAGDATSTATAGTDASSAAGEAGAACDGGALATALRAFATEIAARTESASADAGKAGETVGHHADTLDPNWSGAATRVVGELVRRIETGGDPCSSVDAALIVYAQVLGDAQREWAAANADAQAGATALASAKADGVVTATDQLAEMAGAGTPEGGAAEAIREGRARRRRR